MIKRALMMNAPNYDDEKFFDKITSDALRMAKKAFIGNAKALADYNYTDKAFLVEVPVVVIYGDKDVILDYEKYEENSGGFSTR